VDLVIRSAACQTASDRVSASRS